MSRSAKQRRSSLFSVYVGNLHPDVTEEDIFKLFSKCGTIRDHVLMEPKGNQTCQFGFVRYGCMKEAVQAIKELNGWSVKTQRIIVDIGHETGARMKIEEQDQSESVAALSSAHSSLPLESHINSIKNMVRLKEACVRVNAGVTSYSGAVKISRISTELARKHHIDLARTSKPLKPRSVISDKDCNLKGYKILNDASDQGDSVASDHNNQNHKNERVENVISKLLSSLQIPQSPEKVLDTSQEQSDLLPEGNSIKVQVERSPGSASQRGESSVDNNMASETGGLLCKPSSNCTDHSGLVKDSFTTIERKQYKVSFKSDNMEVCQVAHNLKGKESQASESDSLLPAQSANSKLLSESDSCALISSLPAKAQETCKILTLCTTDIYNPEHSSELPLSIRNSRLARMSGKGPSSARLHMPVPYSSPFTKKCNSEGSLSPESACSWSS
ncbi:nuclear cap-binding protein subunit 2 [Plakobranchus ocellatus]|uniref:Nuclear cap-binding protein subunit 2 n=1 Tax=Plakobranchus ocellatus TaxID=259542 RepID=A0AAV3YN99_9GAST|nr:nuclear cap-binding protein subunit 2 [Plakobranchus ocellatus]